MTARILSDDDYWALRKPFDQYLPDSVPAEEVEAELNIMQVRFSTALAALGEKDDDWELPGHNQLVRVFYAYLHSRKLYTPRLVGGAGKIIGQIWRERHRARCKAQGGRIPLGL